MSITREHLAQLKAESQRANRAYALARRKFRKQLRAANPAKTDSSAPSAKGAA